NSASLLNRDLTNFLNSARSASFTGNGVTTCAATTPFRKLYCLWNSSATSGRIDSLIFLEINSKNKIVSLFVFFSNMLFKTESFLSFLMIGFFSASLNNLFSSQTSKKSCISRLTSSNIPFSSANSMSDLAYLEATLLSDIYLFLISESGSIKHQNQKIL